MMRRDLFVAQIGIAALVALGLVLLVMRPAFAYTCDTTGCTWSTSYTEPATLTNGQALTDLVTCTATYTVSKDGATPLPAATKSFVIPASKPSGGGVVTKNNTDATMLPPHTYAIQETVVCASTAFGTSAPSAPGSLLMNSGVSPNPVPSAPTLQ